MALQRGVATTTLSICYIFAPACVLYALVSVHVHAYAIDDLHGDGHVMVVPMMVVHVHVIGCPWQPPPSLPVWFLHDTACTREGSTSVISRQRNQGNCSRSLSVNGTVVVLIR